jgi:biotin transport system substrate-specific component
MKTRDLVLIALFAALMALCAWITIPSVVPFTMQTFGVFMAVGLLGGKRGTLAVLVYILLGAVGLPVFSGFGGGAGVLFGKTGGYIIGFLASALTMWGIFKIGGKSWVIRGLGMLAGLLVCYAFGTAWFMVVYMRANGPVTLMTVLSWCVIPYIIPDLIKIALALYLSSRIERRITV